MELEVVVGTYDGTINGLTFDVLAPEEKGLRKKYNERDHTGCVKVVASSGRYLATGSTDETIKLYDLRKHIETGTLLQHEGSITWLTFYKDSRLFSASEDGTICVWKCGGGWEHLHTFTGHKYAVTCIAVHPSGKMALSVGKDRTLRTWDLVGLHGAYRQRLAIAADLVVWSPIGDKYVLSFDATITAYDVESGDPIATIEVGKHINSLEFVQHTVLAVGSDHPYIQLFSVTSGDCLTKLDGHTNRVKGLGVSLGNEFLFSASSDGCVKAWRIAEPLNDTRCISSVKVGSRLTSMTVVSPESLKKELKQSHVASDTTVATHSQEPESFTKNGHDDDDDDDDKEKRLTSKRKRKKQSTDVTHNGSGGSGDPTMVSQKNRSKKLKTRDRIAGVERDGNGKQNTLDATCSSTDVCSVEIGADKERKKPAARSKLKEKLKAKNSRRKLLHKQKSN